MISFKTPGETLKTILWLSGFGFIALALILQLPLIERILFLIVAIFYTIVTFE